MDVSTAATRLDGETAMAFIERRMAQRLQEAKRRSMSDTRTIPAVAPPLPSDNDTEVECRRKLDLELTLQSTASRAHAREDEAPSRIRSIDRSESLREVLGARPLLFVANGPGTVSPPIVHSEIWSQHHMAAIGHTAASSGQLTAVVQEPYASPIRKAPLPPHNNTPSLPSTSKKTRTLHTSAPLASPPQQPRFGSALASVDRRIDAPSWSNRSATNDSVSTTHMQRSAVVTATTVPKRESFWITVWPGYYRRARPCRICVSPRFMYFQTVVERAASATTCTPAPSILYSPHGDVVADLEDLVIDGHYIIAPSAVLYRPDMVPDALLHILVKRAKEALIGHTS